MPAFSDSDINQALANMPGWNYEDGQIIRQFRFKDFVEAFGFIAQVATLQEQMNHHATITNTWAEVTLRLSTHSEGGITAKDLELAEKATQRAEAIGESMS